MSRLRFVTAFAALTALGLTLTAAATAEAKHPQQGYMYGKLTTRTGNTYTGLLRWNTEEAFWDDLFHSLKESLPYAKYLESSTGGSKQDIRSLEREISRTEKRDQELRRDYDRIVDRIAKVRRDQERESLRARQLELIEERSRHAEERARLLEELANTRSQSREKTITVLGGALKINWNDWSSSQRIFIARFGDISKITVIGSEDAELTMRDGSTYTVSGYSNDVGGPVWVSDPSLGDIKVDWRKIDTIEFMETPKNVSPSGYRLYGKLFADSGEYEGFIQWDSEECISTDKLDGDSEDGRLSIEMGNIRAIERKSRSSSRVSLKDGRTLNMEGTNDVDGSIRGIMVETEKYGRIKVPWDAFVKVEFSEVGNSGKGYADYAKQWALKGTVKDVRGVERSGRIVFDLDESESWEILNGSQFDIEFNIPFHLVKSITPRSRNSSLVELVNGESIRLESSQDVTSSNDGVLVFDKGEEQPTYISWDEVEVITFTR